MAEEKWTTPLPEGKSRHRYVLGSAVFELPWEFGPARIVGRLAPDAVEFEGRYDAGETVEPGEFDMAEPGEPEYAKRRDPGEAERLSEWVEMFWDQYRRAKPLDRYAETKKLMVAGRGGRS